MTIPEPPTDGGQLYLWARLTEKRCRVGMVKYISAWARLQGFPRRWRDWSEDEVRQAYEAGVRKIGPPPE